MEPELKAWRRRPASRLLGVALEKGTSPGPGWDKAASWGSLRAREGGGPSSASPFPALVGIPQRKVIRARVLRGKTHPPDSRGRSRGLQGTCKKGMATRPPLLSPKPLPVGRRGGTEPPQLLREGARVPRQTSPHSALGQDRCLLSLRRGGQPHPRPHRRTASSMPPPKSGGATAGKRWARWSLSASTALLQGGGFGCVVPPVPQAEPAVSPSSPLRGWGPAGQKGAPARPPELPSPTGRKVSRFSSCAGAGRDPLSPGRGGALLPSPSQGGSPALAFGAPAEGGRRATGAPAKAGKMPRRRRRRGRLPGQPCDRSPGCVCGGGGAQACEDGSLAHPLKAPRGGEGRGREEPGSLLGHTRRFVPNRPAWPRAQSTLPLPCHLRRPAGVSSPRSPGWPGR